MEKYQNEKAFQKFDTPMKGICNDDFAYFFYEGGKDGPGFGTELEVLGSFMHGHPTVICHWKERNLTFDMLAEFIFDWEQFFEPKVIKDYIAFMTQIREEAERKFAEED